jgi:hypothetical protein
VAHCFIGRSRLLKSAKTQRCNRGAARGRCVDQRATLVATFQSFVDPMKRGQSDLALLLDHCPRDLAARLGARAGVALVAPRCRCCNQQTPSTSAACPGCSQMIVDAPSISARHSSHGSMLLPLPIGHRCSAAVPDRLRSCAHRSRQVALARSHRMQRNTGPTKTELLRFCRQVNQLPGVCLNISRNGNLAIAPPCLDSPPLALKL